MTNKDAAEQQASQTADRDPWWKSQLPAITKRAETATRKRLSKSFELSDTQIEILFTMFAMSSAVQATDPRRRGVEPPLLRWAEHVLSIGVEVKRGGRVVMRDPADSHPCVVQLYLAERPLDRKGGLKMESGIVKRIEIRPEGDAGSLLGAGIDLSPYLAAFSIHMMGRKSIRELSDGSVPQVRPAAGKPLNVDFYTALLDAERALREQGHPAPLKELADRLGENPATVRSWVSRGRKRLGEPK